MRRSHVPKRTTRGACRLAILASLALLLLGSAARTQQVPTPVDDSTARIESLERELQELKARSPAPAADAEAVRRIVDEKLKEKDEAEKRKKAEEKKAEEEEKKRKEEEKKNA